MSTNSERLQLYLDAEKAVLEGKSIKFNGREVTMEDLSEIRAGIADLQAKVSNESGGKGGGFKAADFRV